MDFSDHTFVDEIFFSGRILVNAKFIGAKFISLADFRDATFVGTSDFENAEFQMRSRFDDVVFENTVYFKNVTFREITVFDGAVFKVAAYFNRSKFSPVPGIKGCPQGGVGFRNATFIHEVGFENVVFDVQSNFEGAKFQRDVSFRASLFAIKADFQRVDFERISDFSSVKFGREATFNNTSFKSTTYFRRSLFSEPPKFFETNLHEDTDFGGVDWHKAESCYSASWWSKFASDCTKRNTGSDGVDANSAIQAWDRLALVMSKLEKLPERHTFYRLRMRAQRKRDRWGILSFANWLFDVSSDYGWSIRRALSWWSVHFIAMGLFLFLQAGPADEACGALFWDSLLVSFSNAHAFLGLASDGGHLYESRQCLAATVQDSSVLNAVGVIQTITGPILLFLLLLTLRNRFRLG